MNTTALFGGALLTLAGWSAANADEPARQFAAVQSDAITVTATRTEERVDEVPATVSVITDQEIEDNLVTDIEDLVRFEPGVSVQAQPARFSAAGSGTGRTGNAGFNIRGLDGNRVLIMVDGVRVPNAYSFSAVNFGRGDYVDLDLLHAVEILRGPASALYGSDGLAGAVSFTTRDPNSFLRAGEDVGGRFRAGYNSADDSWNESAIGAMRAGAWSGLIGYSRRDGHETENQGDTGGTGATRTEPNPQDWESNAVLARLVFQPSTTHRFRLTAEYADRDMDSDLLSSRGVTTSGPSTIETTDVYANDTSERTRVSFDHTFNNEGGLIDRAFWSVYYQTSEAYQYTFEDRVTLPSTPNDRYRASTYTNDIWGVALQLDSAFDTGAVSHRLTYGLDYSMTRQEGLRDGAPDTSTDDFPTRPFPNTDWALAGVFLQDEISLLDGQLVLYPAVRYDHYEIDPERDSYYLDDPEGQSDSHVTPKFGVVAWPTEHFGAFFSYSGGFKSPAPGQVNEFFQNLVGPFFYYEVIPNPDLEPETSDSVEVGLRWRGLDAFGATWSAQATAYSGWYEDFIEQIQIGGSGASLADPLQFQYVNLSSVEISGFEGRINAQWDNGFGFQFAGAVSEGEYEDNGVRAPLNSIDPLKLVAGLSFDDPQGVFGGQFIVTHVGEKKESDIDGSFYPTDSFTLLDVTAYWNITPQATARIGLFNITDEDYILWSDARDLSDTASYIDAYTQPGANFSASFTYRF